MIISGRGSKVTEATSSVAMEAKGFRRGLNELLFTEGLDIDLITTDWAPLIRKIMQEEYQQIYKCDHTVMRFLNMLGINEYPPFEK